METPPHMAVGEPCTRSWNGHQCLAGFAHGRMVALKYCRCQTRKRSPTYLQPSHLDSTGEVWNFKLTHASPKYPSVPNKPTQWLLGIHDAWFDHPHSASDSSTYVHPIIFSSCRITVADLVPDAGIPMIEDRNIGLVKVNWREPQHAV
jgi:hypothetical protein